MTRKVFISQPMKGKTNEEIKQERERIIHELGEAVVIDSFFEGSSHNANPVWFLGESLKALSQADAAYFAPGWDSARGCKIEHAVCMEYDIEIIHD